MKGRVKKRSTVVPIEGHDPYGDNDGDLTGIPLFADINSDAAYVLVMRDDPEEGLVGRLPVSATEQDIGRKFGGGVFSLSLRNQHGRPLKGGHRTTQIAGDPIFRSRSAELKWKKQMGLDDPAAPRGTGEKPFSLIELMMLMDKQGEKARADMREWASQRERDADLSHQRQIEIMKQDATRREAELRADRERIDRDAKDREERRAREALEERERNREFLQTMLQLGQRERQAQGEADPVKLLVAGIQLARDMGPQNEGDGDPLHALAANLPGVMGEVRKMLTKDSAAEPAPKAADDGEGVTLEGELGDKARALVGRLEAQGKDPAQVLGRAFDVLGQGRPGRPTPKAAAAPVRRQTERKVRRSSGESQQAEPRASRGGAGPEGSSHPVA